MELRDNTFIDKIQLDNKLLTILLGCKLDDGLFLISWLYYTRKLQGYSLDHRQHALGFKRELTNCELTQLMLSQNINLLKEVRDGN